jgi:XTP/dITP diphosphohydrolase
VKRIVIATRSRHKLREIREIFSGVPDIQLLDLDEAGVEPHPAEEGAIEAFDTFEENALAKARYYARRSGTAVLADDSGLCVDALQGAPGVRSKRFAGVADEGDPDLANNRHLLDLLRTVPPPERGAHYVCVLALVEPDGEEQTFVGRCHGEILLEPRGVGGFGYDPLFRVRGDFRTFAEMSSTEKNAVSHRAEALRAAAAFLGR